MQARNSVHLAASRGVSSHPSPSAGPLTNSGISLTAHHPMFATSSVPVPGTMMLRNGITSSGGAVFAFSSLSMRSSAGFPAKGKRRMQHLTAFCSLSTITLPTHLLTISFFSIVVPPSNAGRKLREKSRIVQATMSRSTSPPLAIKNRCNAISASDFSS